jgi:uridine monophosphate synthetase
MDSLVLKLFEIEAVKFGNFKLKSGIFSPIYLDLRVIVSYPQVLREVSEAMWKAVEKTTEFEVMCGVPYTALPIATAMSLDHNLKMLMRRKEVKDYGTKKAIEGHFKAGQTCLIVEDLVTSGMSVLETLEQLDAVSLQCKDVVVLIDREQGGKENLKNHGLNLYSALTISEILEILSRHGKLSDEVVQSVKEFIAANKVVKPLVKKGEEAKAAKRISYEDKASKAKNPALKQLYQTIIEKQSNLSVAVDVTSTEELLKIVEQVGPHICCLKTHVDVLDVWNDQIATSLVSLAKKHNFVVFEDRKFADIGNTVVSQYSAGVYKISEWSDIVNAHIVPGPGIVDGLKKVGLEKNKGLLLLAEMSSAGTMAKGSYTEETVKIAEENSDFVIGFISVNPNSWTTKCKDESLVHITPGIKLQKGGDGLGQQYNDPASAIGRGSDVLIVGRGVYKAENPKLAAQEYQKAGWEAYLSNL